MTATPDDAARSPLAALCLIGLRGSGKSVLGARLAAATGGTFVDLDEAACRRMGVESVTAAFERHGEEGFRRAELETFRDLGERLEPGTVLALGGGTPCSEPGRELVERLKRSGAVIAWLDAPDAALASRLARGTDRPRLRGASIEEEIATLRAERQRTYRRLADLRVDTDAFTVEGAVRSIVSWCRDRIGETR